MLKSYCRWLDSSSWEEFLAHPRKLGWKYENFGNALHLSPSWTAIARLCLSLESLQPLREQAATVRRVNVGIRPVEQRDHPSLVSLFFECFSGSIDYAGCNSSDLLRYAQQSLDHFFGFTPAAFFSACRVALEKERIVGCCMIDRGKHGPVLQPLFVAPSHQRRGVATHLRFNALQCLAAEPGNPIHSKCNLGNEASMAWHLWYGFIEVPCHWTAGHRVNIYLQEAERQELLELPTAVAIRELADFWGEQRKQLEADMPNGDHAKTAPPNNNTILC